MPYNGRVVMIRFIIPDDMTDDEAHDAAELVAGDVLDSYGLGTFDSTEVRDES